MQDVMKALCPGQVVICILLCTAFSSVTAEFTRVGVGVYFLNIGQIQLAGGSCYLDYMLTLKQMSKTYSTYQSAMFDDIADARRRICVSNSDDWLDWNGSAADLDVVNMDGKGTIKTLKNTGTFRVQGDHFFKTNLARWPFETQTLELFIELNSQLQGDVFDVVFCHLFDYSGLSSSLRFPGQRELDLTVDHDISERCWPPFSAPNATCKNSDAISDDCKCKPPPAVHHNISTHFSCRCQGGKRASSRYVGLVEFDRPENTAFINVYLPPFFILLVIMLTYLLPPKTTDGKNREHLDDHTGHFACCCWPLSRKKTDDGDGHSVAEDDDSGSCCCYVMACLTSLRNWPGCGKNEKSYDVEHGIQIAAAPLGATGTALAGGNGDVVDSPSAAKEQASAESALGTEVASSATSVRFKMCAATLLSAIFFHVNLHGQLPPTATLTSADAMMINLYAMNVLAWTVTVVLIMLEMGNKEVVTWYHVKVTYRFTRVVGPVISLPSFFMTYFVPEGKPWVPVVTIVITLVIISLALVLQCCVEDGVSRRATRNIQLKAAKCDRLLVRITEL